MATLSSASSIDEVKAAYDDNASYEEDGDVTKARAFITACRFLIRLLPKRAAVGGGDSGGGHEGEWDTRMIQSELEAAREWIAANATTAADGSARRSTSYSDFSYFRD